MSGRGTGNLVCSSTSDPVFITSILSGQIAQSFTRKPGIRYRSTTLNSLGRNKLPLLSHIHLQLLRLSLIHFHRNQ
jgi:hypothetical protein